MVLTTRERKMLRPSLVSSIMFTCMSPRTSCHGGVAIGKSDRGLNVSGQRKVTAQYSTKIVGASTFSNLRLPTPEGNVFFSRRPREPTTSSREARFSESYRKVD